MNSAYIGKLMELAEKDSNVIHLLADSGTGYDEMFRRNFPNQIYNFGIAEENMVAAAAGMATVGKIPFVFTAGAFLAYRSMEFIRDDVCFQNLNVKIVGMGSGLSWSSLGPTHHTTEDLAVLRAIPNLMILSPATPKQVMECVQIAYEHVGPVYIRIGMNHEKEFYEEDYRMDVASNDILMEGEDLAVFVTGSILEEVFKACELLQADGIRPRLVNVTTIKPFQPKEVLEAAKSNMPIITVEEHNIHGGLAGVIAEEVAFQGLGAKIHPIGMEDTFAAGYGDQLTVRKANGLDAESIYQRIKEAL
ncbi:MAG: transketolase [Lachnospiraceae bacterium]|jgi:transketolase|nr:transketolase [Lachnospiraceae bacterium]